MTDGLIAYRPAVMSPNGMVVAGNAYAASVSAAVLEHGGNAFDAVLAGSAALAVTIPHMNGLGGDAFGLLYDVRMNRASVLNGSGSAPGGASIDAYIARGCSAVPTRGPLSISVPGLVSAWGELADHYCTLPLSRLLAPAIALASDGFAPPREFKLYAESGEYARILEVGPALRTVYGSPERVARTSRLRLPALAETLSAIAGSGTSAFYRGAVAEMMVRDLSTAGAVIKLDDLIRHKTLTQRPVDTGTRLGRLLSCPPNTQGFLLNMIVAELERSGICVGDNEFFVRLLEAKRRAFRVRDRLLGDPETSQIPPHLFEPNLRPAPLVADDTYPHRAIVRSGSADTTGVVAIDRSGNAASWVQSLFDDFGSGIISPASGVVFQNRLSLARFEPDSPGSLHPYFRPPHTLSPALIMMDGRCRLALATPGGHGQVQTLAQIIMALEADETQDLQGVVEAPRICQEYDGEVLVEDRIPYPVADRLAAAGYAMARAGPWGKSAGTANAIGAVMAIHSSPDRMLTGAADPRRDCYAVPVQPAEFHGHDDQAT